MDYGARPCPMRHTPCAIRFALPSTHAPEHCIHVRFELHGELKSALPSAQCFDLIDVHGPRARETH